MKNLTAEQLANGSSYKTANLLADLDSNFNEHEGDIALLATKANPIFTGSVTIPDPPVNASDAATKNYVDSMAGIGISWVDPVEDIVAVLPILGPPAAGARYILSTDDHIYTADGGGGWVDGGATVNGTTTYVKADTGLPANEVGWYNYNGVAWVYIGASGNHNDLTSLQGGGAAEYYHLTAAQHTIATQAATNALNGYLSAADHTAFDAKAPTANPTFTGTVTVPNTSFVYAKLQNVSATDRILGRFNAGAGVIEEIPCTPAARAFLDDVTTAEERTTIGLGNVTNESKTQMFTNPTFTGTVAGVSKAMVGLGSADNTSDLAKPVSTATQSALNLKANIASPTLTGVPAAPTAAAGTNTTQIATTAFVQSAISAGGVDIVLTDGVSTFRFKVRSGSLCLDQTITVLGFAGAENTDWANINEYHL